MIKKNVQLIASFSRFADKQVFSRSFQNYPFKKVSSLSANPLKKAEILAGLADRPPFPITFYIRALVESLGKYPLTCFICFLTTTPAY